MSGLLLAVRCVMAAVWFYNGLWLKLIARDAHHLEIVSAVVAGTRVPPVVGLSVIGGGETLLALGVLSGLWPRFVNGFQIGLLVVMNVCGIIFGGGAIERPVGLLIANLPLIACASMVIALGPGRFAMGRGGGERRAGA